MATEPLLQPVIGAACVLAGAAELTHVQVRYGGNSTLNMYGAGAWWRTAAR